MPKSERDHLIPLQDEFGIADLLNLGSTKGLTFPELSVDDVEQLRDLPVTAPQLEELRGALLHASLFRRRPALNEMRAMLKRTCKAADATISTLQAMAEIARADFAARHEIAFLLSRADAADGTELDLGILARQLSMLKVRALNELERLKDKTQTRHRALSALPQLVDQALRRGAGLAIGPSAWTPPDYAFTPSNRPKSPFYEVVWICQRAITGAETEPDRAIDAYLQALAE